MAFDVGAGLSAAGAAVADTAKTFVAENIRAELEQQKILLADQLAGAREEKQRVFTAGESEKQRTWHSGESQKDRDFKGEEGRLDRESRLATTSMSAGASIRAAEIGRDTQLEISKRGLEARATEHDKTLQAAIDAATKIQIGEDGTAYAVNPITKKVEPFKLGDEVLKFRDPDVAKAQVELIKAKTAQLRDITSTHVPQIQALEASIRSMQKNLIPGDKGGQRELEEAQARLKGLQEKFDAEKAPIMYELNEYARQFANKGKMTPPASGGGRPPLSDLITIPGQQPQRQPGLIDTPPE